MFDIAASYFISFVRLYLNTCITCRRSSSIFGSIYTDENQVHVDDKMIPQKMKVQPNRKVYIKRPERKIKALAIHASHSSLGEHLDAGVDPNEGEDYPDAIGNNHEGPDFRWSKALVPSVPDETEKIDKCPIHNLPVRGDADAAHHEG